MPKSNKPKIDTNNKDFVVYKACLIDPDDSPVKIARFLDVDEDGILEIGQTGDIETRKKDFNRGSSNHSEGERFSFVKKYSEYTKKFSNHKVELFVLVKLSSGEEAKKEEARLLKCYFIKFGELPPLNHQFGKKIGWENLNCDQD